MSKSDALNTVTCKDGRTPWMNRLRIENTGDDTVKITSVDLYTAGTWHNGFD